VYLFLTYLCNRALFDKYTGKPIEDWLVSLSFLFLGLSGLPIIIRKEMNLFVIYLEGPIAIVYGALLLILGIAIATIHLWGPLLR
jgi:hypothetical protein